MRFQAPRVIVVGFLLGLAAVGAWGEAAAGVTLRKLTVPGAIPPEEVLWEGVAVPLAEVQRRAAITEAKWLEDQLRVAELWEAQLREVQQREAAEAAKPRETGPRGGSKSIAEAMQKDLQRQRKDLEDRLRKAHQVAAAPGTTVSDASIPLLPILGIGRPDVWHLSERYPLERMPRGYIGPTRSASFRTEVNNVVTLLGKSKTRGKAVLHRPFEGTRDRRHSPHDTHARGVGDWPLRLTQQRLS
jgi:hypothetical protein